MAPASPDTDELLDRTAHGDRAARDQLLTRHRQRLRQAVAYRLDRRLAARVDPSDVLQEVLAEASRRLPDYLRERPLPFYPWLRQMALERLAELHRRHVRAQRRSVRREEPGLLPLPDESASELADRLVNSASSPSQRLLRREARERVQAALRLLAPADREVLELRYLEQLSAAETAAVLGLSAGAARSRHLRAVRRLRALLEGPAGQEQS
jgi:RNA polymerase sigma-70 factor (ECF subfamily)